MTPLLIALAFAQPPSLEARVTDLETRVTKLEGKPPSPSSPPARPTIDELSRGIIRTQYGNSGCTAGVIAERLPSGQYLVFSAAHCWGGRLGDAGTGFLKDGSRVRLRVVSLEASSDAAWLVTENAPAGLPTIRLAAELPPRGSRIWHRGFGVDAPESLNYGRVEGVTADGRLHVTADVSSGDSGGPHLLESTGEVVMSTCCTAKFPRPVFPGLAPTYGAHCLTARRLRAAIPPESLAPRVNAGEADKLADKWEPSPVPNCGEVAGVGAVANPAAAADAYAWVLAEVRAGRAAAMSVGVTSPDAIEVPAGVMGGPFATPGVYDFFLANGVVSFARRPAGVGAAGCQGAGCHQPGN